MSRYLTLEYIRITDEVLNSTPLLKDLCRVITPDYAAHWKVIGALLGLPTTCLDETETTNPTNLQWCCNDMLKMWLARNTNATWKDALVAIDSPTLTPGVPSLSDVLQSGPLAAHQVTSQLSDFVKTNYIKGRYYSQEGIWQLLHPKHFDNALWIHRLEGRGEKEVSNIAALMREGLTGCTHQLPSPDNVQSESDGSEMSHNIADAFKPFDKCNGTTVTPEVIVISGAPGMGKTTLCKEMAYQWAKGQFLDNSCLVFFVYLRDPEAQKICDLQSFVHYFYNFDKAAVEFSKQCADVLTERNNKDIAILLVGYDEHFNVSGNLFLTDIINQKVSCFAQSKLVITCGPIATDKLQHVTDVKVDLFGFTDKSKKAYIQKELQGSPDKIERLSSFLDENSTINNICTVPIIMSILVYTFKEVDELPADQAEVYEHFITLTILQCVENVEKADFKVLRLQQLPECYRQYIVELSKFAFTMKDDKIIFTSENLGTLCPTVASASKMFQEIGLLKSVQYFSMKTLENCYAYKFIYSGIQEFLATYYVNSLSPDVQFDLLKETLFSKKHTDTGLLFVKNLNKNEMFEYFEYLIHGTPCKQLKVKAVPTIADLDPFQAFTQFANICTRDISLTHSKLLCYKNNETQLYKTDNSNSLETYVLFSKFVAIKPEWNKVYLSLCCARNSDSQSLEIFVIDKSTQEGLYAKLATHFRDNSLLSVVIINAVSMIAFRATKQHLSDGFDMNNSISHITLRHCDIDEQTAESLSQYFSKSRMETAAFLGCTFNNFGHKKIFNGFSSISTLKILFFDNANIDETTAVALSSVITNNNKLYLLGFSNCNLRGNASIVVAALKNISTVLTLGLSDNKIPGSVADELAIAIYVNCKIERLRLADNNLQHQGAVVASALSQIKTLVELDLSNNNMTEKVADELSLAIESNKSLQVLRIGGNNLQNVGIIRIAATLFHLSKLRILAIDNNQITEEAADSIAVAISCNIQLEVLNLNNNLLKKGVTIIANALHTNKIPLETLAINSNQIPEETADALAAAIRSNCLLEVLNLYNNNLHDGGIIAIAQSLASLSSLTFFSVASNRITCKCADTIASIIRANPRLETLYLHENSLGTGVTVIANALQEISSLKTLNLSNNQIPESAANDLAAALLNNKSLQVVSLGDNQLTTKGVQTISQALSNLSELQSYNINNNYCTEEASDAISSVVFSNANLQYVYIGGNNLQTGVMKMEKAFKYMLIKELNLKNSNISEHVVSSLALAISSQYYLEEFAFQGNNVGIHGIITVVKSLSTINKLKLINLDNTSLTEEAADAIASAISSNCELEQLYLGNNKLCTGGIVIAKALKSLSKLRILDFNDSGMSADVADEISSAITNNPTLEDLRLKSNKLTTKGVIKIAKSLTSISTLQVLNFQNNQVSEEAAVALSAVISSNTEIKHLWLANNSLQSGLLKVIKALETLPKLRALDIGNNRMPQIVQDELAAFMQFSSLSRNLWTLYLDNSDLRLSGVKIAGTLCHFTNLRILDLNDNNMTGEMADRLAVAIPKMTSLQQLWLRNNNLGNDKVIRIALSLSTLTTILQLGLASNQITEEAADAIVAAMQTNDSLEKLYLSDNDLRAGVLKIVNALKNVLSLRVLYLDNNSIPDMVYVQLAKIIAKMNLEMLDLSFNCLQLSGRFILQAISSIHTLTYLNLNNCFLTDECSTDLIAAIENNIAFSSLYLRANQLATNGVVSICQSLKGVSTLKNLNIGNNEVDSDCAEAIASVVLNNRNITMLTLTNCKLQSKTIQIFKGLRVVSSLTTLHLGYMDMSNDVVADLVLAMSHNPLLKELNLCGNLLSSGLIEIVQACKNLKYLLALDLQWNSVDPSEVTELAQVIGTINTLEVLCMGGVILKFNEKYIENLGLHLEKIHFHFNSLNKASAIMVEALNYELQRHKISSNIKANYDTKYSLFNYTDAVIISELFDSFLTSKHNVFESLQKSKQKPSRVDAATIIYFLPIISKVKVLDLEQSNIDEVAAFELAALVGCNGVLEQLWLGGNQLSTAGAIFILNSLVHLSTLKALDLSYNNIGCQSADSVAAVVQCNPMLQYLSLDGNDLMDSGVVTICQALKCITKLRILGLSNNGITDNSAEAITFVICSNNCLEDLSLGNSKLKSKEIFKIVCSLKNLCRLRKLDLLHTEVTNHIAEELAVVISNCYTLQELYLSDNKLETEGAIKIFESLKHKSKLQVLSLSNNSITDEAIDELCLVLAQNPRLQVLLLGGNKLQTDGAVRIAQVVKRENTIMRLLGLCENGISEQGKEQVKMMFTNDKLIHVYI